MTLACRFGQLYRKARVYVPLTIDQQIVPTDQWLTTRVDRTWTVSQVKHHMLTKVWGGRRYQLSLPRNLTNAAKTAPHGTEPGADEGSRRMSISSSNYSSVVFAASVQGSVPGDYERSHYTFDTVINGSSASLDRSSVTPGTPDGGRTPRLTRSHSSTDLASRGRPKSASSSHKRGKSVSGQRPTSNRSDSIIRDLRREEAMDRLYERMEATVKRRVLKAAKNYRVVSFSNVSAWIPNPTFSRKKHTTNLFGQFRVTFLMTIFSWVLMASNRLSYWRFNRPYNVYDWPGRPIWSHTLRPTPWSEFAAEQRSTE